MMRNETANAVDSSPLLFAVVTAMAIALLVGLLMRHQVLKSIRGMSVLAVKLRDW